MKIYGLVGSSGTGKSFKAGGLANEKEISCLIDDGLLIKGARILAGVSAKKESTKLSAIRRALFMDPDHAAQVKEAIRELNPDSILILGTSVHMIDRIAMRLELPPVDEYIRIEDISSSREIQLAQRQRKEEGKHIIPVPTFEVRKDFSGFFIDPIRIFRILGKGRQVETLEKTVVRPTYSYFGKFFIADSAIEAIAAFCAQSLPEVSKILRCEISSRVDGISIDIEIAVIYGCKIHKVMEQIQEKVQEEVGYMTGLNILSVNVTAKRLVLLKNDSTI